MNRYIWRNIVLDGSQGPSRFEKAVAVVVIILGLLMCGFGPMG